MNKKAINEKTTIVLPAGDYLRQYLIKNEVQKNDLSKILKNRGVFLSDSNDKHTIISILIKTGLSPLEYAELVESYKTKEESQKFITRSIVWKTDVHLLDCMRNVNENNPIDCEELLKSKFENCEVSKLPFFTPINRDINCISTTFEITRNDITKNWGADSTIHKGSIELKRSKNNAIEVNLQITYTSRETKYFAQSYLIKLIKNLKEFDYIDRNENMKMIRFSDFTNKSRVLFFNQLSRQALSGNLSFLDTTHIQFSHDETLPDLPDNLMWMKNKIDELALKGQQLHSTFFIDDEKYHEYIMIFGLYCNYGFDYEEGCGKCSILFDFPREDKLEESELTIHIDKVNFNKKRKVSLISRENIKKKILASIEENKTSLYLKHKI